MSVSLGYHSSARKMRSLLLLLLLATAAAAAAHATETTCDRHTRLAGGSSANPNDQIQLMNRVVTRLLSGVDEGQAGLLALDSPLLATFNTDAALTGESRVTHIANRLVSFIGTALGCTAVGFPLLEPDASNLDLSATRRVTHSAWSEFGEQLAVALITTIDLNRTELARVVVPYLHQFGLCAAPVEICNDRATCQLAPNAAPICAQQYLVSLVLSAASPKNEVDYTKITAIVLAVHVAVLAVLALGRLMLERVRAWLEPTELHEMLDIDVDPAQK